MPSIRLRHAGLAASLLVHGVAVGWCLNRPPAEPMTLGVAQEMAVTFIAPPAELPQPPAPQAPAAEIADEKEPVVEHKPAPRPRPVMKTPAAVPVATETPVNAPAAAPAPPAPQPVMTSARYDADYLNNPAPVYPAQSRRLREEGRVLLRVQVSADGFPLTVDISETSGFARLDQAAREAASRWRFVPARLGDAAQVSWVTVPVQFSLRGVR